MIKHRNLNELHKAIFTPQYRLFLPPDALHTAVEASGSRIAKSTLGWSAAQHQRKLVVDFRRSRINATTTLSIRGDVWRWYSSKNTGEFTWMNHYAGAEKRQLLLMFYDSVWSPEWLYCGLMG